MQAHITRTKGWLQAQAQKQQDAHVQLKSYIDDEIRAVHERISAQIRDSQLGLKACVDSLGRNVQDLKDAMRWVSWCQSPPASMSVSVQLMLGQSAVPQRLQMTGLCSCARHSL